MAKNWQPKEAIELIAKKDTEALNDLGKRFPLFTAYASAALAGDVEGLKKFVEGIPNHISVRQMNTRMNQAAGGEGDSEDFEEKPKKKAPAKTKGKKAPAKKSKKVEEDFEDFEDDFEDDDMGEEIDFDSMSPTELKAEAKKRKINIKGMKKAQVIKALKDSVEEGFEDEDDDDDWGVDI